MFRNVCNRRDVQMTGVVCMMLFILRQTTSPCSFSHHTLRSSLTHGRLVRSGRYTHSIRFVFTVVQGGRPISERMIIVYTSVNSGVGGADVIIPLGNHRTSAGDDAQLKISTRAGKKKNDLPGFFLPLPASVGSLKQKCFQIPAIGKVAAGGAGRPGGGNAN